MIAFFFFRSKHESLASGSGSGSGNFFTKWFKELKFGCKPSLPVKTIENVSLEKYHTICRSDPSHKKGGKAQQKKSAKENRSYSFNFHRKPSQLLDIRYFLYYNILKKFKSQNICTALI